MHTPVSYTHLDVYKRQEQILPLAPDADADKLAKKALENAGIKFDEKSKKDDTCLLYTSRCV